MESLGVISHVEVTGVSCKLFPMYESISWRLGKEISSAGFVEIVTVLYQVWKRVSKFQKMRLIVPITKSPK
jgi:hypothetical protein